ncbi:unnamed protein product, partial [Meganyctiphanes norvegica]
MCTTIHYNSVLTNAPIVLKMHLFMHVFSVYVCTNDVTYFSQNNATIVLLFLETFSGLSRKYCALEFYRSLKGRDSVNRQQTPLIKDEHQPSASSISFNDVQQRTISPSGYETVAFIHRYFDQHSWFANRFYHHIETLRGHVSMVTFVNFTIFRIQITMTKEKNRLSAQNASKRFAHNMEIHNSMYSLENYPKTPFFELQLPNAVTWQTKIRITQQKMTPKTPFSKLQLPNAGKFSAQNAPKNLFLLFTYNSKENYPKKNISELQLANAGVLFGTKLGYCTLDHDFHIYLSTQYEHLDITQQIIQQITQRVYTPKDPLNTWMLAKMYYNNAEAQFHQALSHFCYTHSLMDGIATSMNRQLSPSHPIYKLLRPHFKDIISINKYAGKTILKYGTMLESWSMGFHGFKQLILKATPHITFKRAIGSVESDATARGVWDKQVLPYYPFRDDAMALYNIIKKYVTTIITHYYGTTASISSDWELQNWHAELAKPRAQGGVGITDLPGTRGNACFNLLR